jgi:hypothetical protein
MLVPRLFVAVGAAEGYSDRIRRHPLVAPSESYEQMRKARSLLVLLIATCQQTLLGLDATANILDSEMTELLRTMINRSERELEVLTEKMNAAS